MADLMAALLSEGAVVTSVTFKKGDEHFKLTLTKVGANGGAVGKHTSTVGSAEAKDIEVSRGNWVDGKFTQNPEGTEILAEAKGFKSRYFPVADVLAAAAAFTRNTVSGEYHGDLNSKGKEEWYSPVGIRHPISPAIVTAVVKASEQ